MYIIIQTSPGIPLDILDAVISAEVPDPKEYPELYRIVTEYIIYSNNYLKPDSESNFKRYNPRGNSCVYCFPKDLNEKTKVDNKGYI